MTDTIQYILRFMVGEQLPDDINRLIGYTSDATCYADYKVVIIPSEFFDEGVYGTARTNPVVPVQIIEGIPFLFGTPEIERVGETLVVHADLVASAFFLLSRYDEVIHRAKRDPFGRFPGCESIANRAGFIDRPVVDEYGKLIRKWLQDSGVSLKNVAPHLSRINLTHDVDAPFHCRTWRNVARNVFSGQSLFCAMRAKYGRLENDLYYTFPRILKQNNKLQEEVGEKLCQTILFFKAGGKTKNDKPRYDLYGKDIRALFTLCREQGAAIGLHSSFQAGMEPACIASEKKKLEDAYGQEIRHNRHHFLSSREPEDMEMLEQAGITDDYTMGYADITGFRLGTSFPVRYINPVTRRLTSLTLHPLVIMDGTLFNSNYMNLTAEQAEDHCKQLIHNIRQVNGELTLLWHNTVFAKHTGGYLRTLYSNLLRIVK